MRATACFSMYSDMSSRTSASHRRTGTRRARARSPSCPRRGAQENEGPRGPVGILQPGARPAHRIGDGGERFRLADHAPLELASSRVSRSRSDSSIFVTGIPVHLATISAMSSASTSSSSICPFSGSGPGAFPPRRSPARARDPPVADFGGLLQVAATRRLLGLGAELFELGLLACSPVIASFSACHCAFITFERSRSSASSCSTFARRSFEALSFSLASAASSIFVLHDLPLDLVDLLRRESISMRSRLAASSTRSMALSAGSGRRCSDAKGSPRPPGRCP